MRPLARWTIGPVSQCGMEILKFSIHRFKKIYPEFDTVVCYNHISAPFDDSYNLFEQHQHQINYPLSAPEKNPTGAGMRGSGWKLCPPRLSTSHELWIDNDIVIFDRVKEIDEWLMGNHSIISEGLHGSYGVFRPKIKPSVKVCAGLFGLPPNFDFGPAILDYCDDFLKGESLGHYDEQGLVAAIVTNSSHKIVPFTSLKICETNDRLPSVLPPAIHFVGANRTETHRPWMEYNFNLVKLL